MKSRSQSRWDDPPNMMMLRFVQTGNLRTFEAKSDCAVAI